MSMAARNVSDRHSLYGYTALSSAIPVVLALEERASFVWIATTLGQQWTSAKNLSVSIPWLRSRTVRT